MELKATANDSIILTSLKPMREAVPSIPALFYDENRNAYLGIPFDADHVVIDGSVLRLVQFIGWHHVPKVDDLYFTDEEIKAGKEMAKAVAEYENSKND